MLFSCNKKINDNNIKSFYSIVQTTDSIPLSFPDSLFPKHIVDAVITHDNIYILNLDRNTKYPVTKLTRNGNYIKTIMRIGNGPEEIKFLPFKISGNKNILVAGSPTLNTIYVYKNDTLHTKRSFWSKRIKFSDIMVLKDNNILCSSYGDTKYHLFLLNNKLKIIDKFIPLPKKAKLTTLAGFLNFYALSGDKNSIISHYSYPAYVYEIKTKDPINKSSVNIRFKGQGLSKFISPNYSRIQSDYQKGKIRPLEVYKKFSRIHLIYKEKNYIMGIYLTSFGKKAEKHAFILQNDHLIKEIHIPDENTKGLFVYDSGLARSIYYKENGVLKVKLLLLKFNPKFL